MPQTMPGQSHDPYRSSATSCRTSRRRVAYVASRHLENVDLAPEPAIPTLEGNVEWTGRIAHQRRPLP